MGFEEEIKEISSNGAFFVARRHHGRMAEVAEGTGDLRLRGSSRTAKTLNRKHWEKRKYTGLGKIMNHL